jgi:hypothetical protein
MGLLLSFIIPTQTNLTSHLYFTGTKTRTGRRGAGCRSSARAQGLGKLTVAPVQRGRAAAATPATNTAKAVTQGSDEIIVSNLPGDVNEASSSQG